MIFVLKQMVLPPISLILLALLGLAVLRRRKDAGWWIALTALTLLLLLATPLGVTFVTRNQPVPLAAIGTDLPDNQAQAIVILGCDSDYHVELGGEDVGPLTLARLRFGARLQRRTGLPILLSGGRLEDESTSLAELMRRSLKADFGLTSRWLEEKSRDTWENATLSSALLRQQGISRIYLVTQAGDMARAQWSFERAGLQVIAAPTGFDGRRPDSWPDIAPSAKSLLASYYAIYEMAGGVFYKIFH